MLFDPTPRSLKGLIPWENFWKRLVQLPFQHLQSKADEILSRLEAESAPLAKAKRKILAEAETPEEYASELVVIALEWAELTAYVSYPTKDKAFRIKAFVWSTRQISEENAFRSIEDGVLKLDPQKYPPNSLERELANRPLFIERGVASEWFDVRPTSEAMQRETADAVIAEFKSATGNRRMKREDFIVSLMERLPGLSRERAKKLWRERAPPNWKMPGPK
jgi:hypothetical protein